MKLVIYSMLFVVIFTIATSFNIVKDVEPEGEPKFALVGDFNEGRLFNFYY